MKQDLKIALLGFGTVGTGIAKVLEMNAHDIQARADIAISIEKVLVRDINKSRTGNVAAKIFTTSFDEIINDKNIDIIVEVMGGEFPAKDYIIQALNNKKHVVTANKDLMAKYGKELLTIAEENKVNLLFEASVAGGIPIIRPLKKCLSANKIDEVIGIINGTTNYMLTKMTDEHMPYSEVLAEAQAKGYAEADPSADVDGLDAARKLAILASLAFNSRVTLDDVYVEGISAIDTRDIEYARELGYVIKLLAVAKENENGLEARVHPTMIKENHPLASVDDVFNAIFIRGNAIGDVMFYGRGAGDLPTASAVIADIVDVAKNIGIGIGTTYACTCYDEKPICSINQTMSLFYIRLLVADKPGVLAAIAGAFGAQQVSLNTVIQKRILGDNAELVLVTSRVTYENIRLAINTLNGMSIVSKVNNVIRVEN